MPTTLHEAHSRPAINDELARSVHTLTARQVQGLKIDCRDGAVVVTGQSRSYYVKQLVTHAILNCLPSATLRNDILVCVP